jgi:hypothetical protein
VTHSPVRIRVYPEEGSRLYALAHVWPTVGAMRTALKIRGPKYAAINQDIEVYRVHPDGSARKFPVFAHVHFPRRNMGGGIVAHEFLHTTLAWARRLALDLKSMYWRGQDEDDPNVSAVEERLCMAHGRMVAQFINRCYELGIYSVSKTTTRGTG